MTTNNEESTRAGFSPKQSLVMAVICLVLGVAVGYLVRGSHPGKNNVPAVTRNAAMPAMATNMQVAPGELKRMADEQSKPILEKLKSDPKDAAALAQLGDLRFDAGQYKEAIAYYEQSLAIEPKNVRVRGDMANSYAYSGNPDRAILEYENGLKYDPKSGLCLLNMGMVQWHDKGDVKSAVATWEKLIKLNPQFAQQVQVEQLIAKAKQHTGKLPPAR